MEGVAHIGPGIPVIAVMPISAPDAAEQVELLAEGLHEDICAALSRFRSLTVISPRSAQAVAALGDAEVGCRLGASHVLRGRLHQHPDRLRLSASLIACAEARQLWVDDIVIAPANVLDLRDEVVGRIASTLHARLDGIARAEARRSADPHIHGLVLHGLHMLRKGTPETDEKARAIFEQVLARDPANARAHAGIALSWFNQWSCQFWDRFEETSQLAYTNAHRALELDEDDAVVHLVIAKVQLFRRAFESAAWYLDRALALSPNDADLLVQAALCEVYLGRPEAGLEHIARAIRLHPFHPNDYFATAALAHFLARNLDTALAMHAKADALPFVDYAAFVASALAHAGRLEEARRALAVFHADYEAKIAFGVPVEPGDRLRWFIGVNPFRRPEDVAYLVEGLKILGESEGARRPKAEPATTARLVRIRAGWIAEFDGHRETLPDLKGLHDLRRLLERPGQEVHCLDLAERSETTYGADAALDGPARAALKARIRDLGEELAEAEVMNDLGRAERARSEMDRLLETLSNALGLGGRGRRIGDLAERARTTVTWRIRYALRRIEAAHPRLGRHLATALRTGAFCVYRPDPPVTWRFDTVIDS